MAQYSSLENELEIPLSNPLILRTYELLFVINSVITVIHINMDLIFKYYTKGIFFSIERNIYEQMESKTLNLYFSQSKHIKS